MIDFTLTEEQRALQETAREFATREISPIAENIAREKISVPWTLCKALFEQGAALGFVTLLLPEQYGGHNASCLDLALVMEEMGAADVAIAANYFNLPACLMYLVARAGSETQRAEILSKPRLLSGALSEPNVAGSDLFCPTPNARIGIQTTATRDGDAYILNGNKSAFVTNAGIADGYFVLARTAFDKPVAQAMTMLYVPVKTTGLSFGKRTEMIGWHTAQHAEIFLENVRVPAANRIGEEGQAGLLLANIPEMAIGLAACFVGLARAAYENVLAYAKTRVSWGKPLVEHQAVALKLSEMFVQVQAARLLVWDAARACETNPLRAATLLAPAAKTFAVDAAIHNAQRAVEIFGAYGVTQEYRAGRYLNDAWIGYACDFTRDVLRLGMVPFL